MSAEKRDHAQHRRKIPWAARSAIALTAGACLAALVFRTPLRSRYWAWQVERADGPGQRSVYLAALCNAGDHGRWGIDALLQHSEAEVRQYGVLVLHHVRTRWSRQRLLECVADTDPDVQRLAAVGLALHGDDAVIPTLKRLYRTGDAPSATAACLALERLGTAEATGALDELARQPAEPVRRAALVDALAAINKADCVPALIRLLSDQRLCAGPSQSEAIARRALSAVQQEGRLPVPASVPTTQPDPKTIAERAAAALIRITGLRVPFSSAAPQQQREEAARRWAEWYASQP